MTYMTKVGVSTLLFFTLFTFSSVSLKAEHPCTSPLVLDINGNQVAVSHPRSGTDFDINGDGVKERIGWPVWDALLWIDLNRNGVVSDGSELFGTSTLLPSGEYADNGFEALAVYDHPDFGGDGDGVIAPGDLAWAHLRLWQDTNRDGLSQRDEITTLAATGVVWIGLDHEVIHELDGGGNHRIARGLFGMRHRELGAWKVHEQVVDDVLFAVLSHEH
jgi:hypothetical protein